MIGPIVNGAALFAGSTAGALIGARLNPNLSQRMPMVFGCASMGLGIAMIVKVKFLAPVVLAMVAGTLLGELGQMNEGMTGDPTLLVVKSILDLFTAPIFAATMGMAVGILVVPQFLIQTGLYFSATLILPLATPDMLADFSACGGMIMLATGFRICGIKQFPVASMIPALFLVMPLSWVWAASVG